MYIIFCLLFALYVEIVLPAMSRAHLVSLQAVAHLMSARPNFVDQLIWMRPWTVTASSIHNDNVYKRLRAPAPQQRVHNRIMLGCHLFINRLRQPVIVPKFADADDAYDNDLPDQCAHRAPNCQ